MYKGAHCNEDDECLDEQICVYGTCQSTFPRLKKKSPRK